ncbi:MAG: ComEC/Rec2 family competence protein [Chloroflexi bacterium]|nr:ComEC/Rec2 family competence protein [Chloroflexota bacterium]
MPGGVILPASVAWVTGIVLGCLLGPNLLLAAVGGILLCAAGAIGSSMGVRALAFVLGVLALGMARGALVPPDGGWRDLEPYAGQVSVVGRVLDEPVARGRLTELRVEAAEIAAPSRLDAPLVLDDARPRLQVLAVTTRADYGDLVEIRGRLARPRSRPGWPVAEILARQEVYWQIDGAVVRVRQHEPGDAWSALLAVRRALAGNIRASLPEPHASLAVGIVLGTRAGLSADLRAVLAATGTSHTTAVSGFNVAMVAGLCLATFVRTIGRPWALLPTTLAIWAYVAVVGAPPSAVRAAAMASVALSAQAAGRLVDPATALLLAVAALVGWDPGLAFDLGFQLSATATAGLILLGAPLSNVLGRLPTVVREPAALVLAAELATLPIVLATFRQWSLVSLPANVLVAEAIPAIMVTGGLLALVAPLPGIGDALAWATWLSTAWMVTVVQGLAALPWATGSVGQVPPWLIASWYAAVLVWIGGGSPELRTRFRGATALRPCALGIAVVAVAASWLPVHGAGNRLTISLLDVGNSAAFVRAPSGHTALLGTSASGSSVAAAVGQRLDFWERRFSVLVVSETETSPGRGLQGASGRYPPDLIVMVEAPGNDGEAPEGGSSSGEGDSTPASGEPAAQPASGEDAVEAAGGQGDVQVAVTARPGLRIDLGSGVVVEVVDVRSLDDRVVADLAVCSDRLAVWLPAPGPPSPRWVDVCPDRPSVVHLTSRTPTWLSTAPPRPWLAVIQAAPFASQAPDLDGVALFDHRLYGTLEVEDDDGVLGIRGERCDARPPCWLLGPLSAPASREYGLDTE